MPWCPRCRVEYDAGVATCVDCACDLVEHLLPEDLGKEPVVVFRAGTANEARTVVATLEAEGIPAYSGSPDYYVPQYGNPVAGVSPEFMVWVPADAVEAAQRVMAQPELTDQELLDAEQATDPDPDEDEPVE